MTKHPIVFDKFDTEYDGYGIAILENTKEVRITERLNGEKLLNLVLPRNDPKWEYIKNDNFIKVERDLFIIRSTDELKDEKGNTLSNIQCEHIFTELIDHYIYDEVNDLNAKEYIAQSAQIILDDILKGSRFKADASRLTGLRDLWLEDATGVEGVQEVRKQWDCEFICDGLPDVDGKFKITFMDKIGADNSIQFRYKKNLQTIRRTTDAKNVITRLYVYGKDGLGIRGASKNTADKAYIDSKYINNYPRPKCGYVYFRDIDDKDKLYEEGLKYLEKVEVPKVTYETSIVELKRLPGYRADFESFGLGDVITVIDEDLQVKVTERIVEYEYYPYEPKRSTVKLANFDDDITDFLTGLNDTKQAVDKTTTKKGLNTHWLDGVINALQNRIIASAAYTKAEVREDEGILFENTDTTSADYGALYIGPNILAIADKKKSNGTWDWRSFGTGSGFTADEINTGILRAALVKIIADEATYIDGGGLHVVDNNNIERLRIGKYAVDKFGLLLRNKAGDTTIISEDGLLQTWQEGRADNVDNVSPLILNVYIPSETISIKKALLRFRLQAFRAYSKGTASGGASTRTTTEGGGVSTTTANGGGTTRTTSTEIGKGYLSQFGTDSTGTHNHGIPDGTQLATAGGGTVTWTASGLHSHYNYAHGHEIEIPEHSHSLNIPKHSHSVQIPEHSHGIDYGIYTSSTATGVGVIINGVDMTSVLGGSFNGDRSGLDITQYLVKGQWNEIRLTSNRLGRIDANVFIQAFIGV